MQQNIVAPVNHDVDVDAVVSAGDHAGIAVQIGEGPPVSGSVRRDQCPPGITPTDVMARGDGTEGTVADSVVCPSAVTVQEGQDDVAGAKDLPAWGGDPQAPLCRSPHGGGFDAP